MLKQAVTSHKTTAAPRASGLAARNGLLTVPPPVKISSTTAPGLALTQKRDPHDAARVYQRSNPLTPSQEAMLNSSAASSARRGQTSGAAAMAASSRLNGLSNVLKQENSFQENHVVAPPPRMGKVDMPVYFHEDDFEDDADIDLDIEDPASKAYISPPPDPSSLTRGAVVGLPAPSFAGPPLASSAPLPWSSSPVEHRLLPGHLLPLPTNRAPATLRAPEERNADGNPRPKKRRQLPWLGATEAEEQRDAASATATADRSGRVNPGDHARPVGRGTPPSHKSTTQYPWDTTASAVKDEQRRLRKTQKKSQTTDEPGQAAAKKTALGKVFLSEEQKRVSRLAVQDQKSVFFTGSAGTGKSVLLREIIRSLKSKYSGELDRVAVTASTGLAACNIGGVTLHSFSGIGLGKEAAKDLVKKVKKNLKAKTRWMRTKVLIIDEISMVDGELFDKLEEVARLVRNNGRPFGGIQLVITGDFFQLPPVPDHGRVARFAFEASTWSTAIVHTIGLTQVFRQKDPVFAGILNEMRLGRLTPQSIETFRSLSRPIQFDDDLDATELFPTRSEVDNANNMKMNRLGGDGMVFEAKDGGTMTDKYARDKLLANCMAPPLLGLKRGAQVMLIKNLDEQLVNGSLGKVVDFMDEEEFEIFQRNEEHSESFEMLDPGHAEMARLRKKLRARADAEFPRAPARKWPYVCFSMADGTSRCILCQPEMWKIELPNGEVQASRSQVPLILAWALSIHKAQGQTLERVKVDLGKVFEKGQAYVALSRATCQEGLQVLRFDPRKVMAHDRVREFYNGLYRAEGGTAAPTPSGLSQSGSLSRALSSNFDDDDEEAAYG